VAPPSGSLRQQPGIVIIALLSPFSPVIGYANKKPWIEFHGSRCPVMGCFHPSWNLDSLSSHRLLVGGGALCYEALLPHIAPRMRSTGCPRGTPGYVGGGILLPQLAGSNVPTGSDSSDDGDGIAATLGTTGVLSVAVWWCLSLRCFAVRLPNSGTDERRGETQ